MLPSGLHVTAATLPKSLPVIVAPTDWGVNCKPFNSSFGTPEAPFPFWFGPQMVVVEGRGTSWAQVPLGGVSHSVYFVDVEKAALIVYEPSAFDVVVESGCAPP